MPPQAQEEKPLVDGEIQSVDSSIYGYFLAHKRHTIIVISVVVATEVILILLKNEIFFLYVLPVLWPVIEYYSIKLKLQRAFIQQFARENGYTFLETTTCGTTPFFSLGHDARVRDAIEGEYHGHPIVFYTYSYTVGYGKHKSTYTSSVISLGIVADMPDITLLSANNYSRVPSPSGSNKLRLEGDFNKYFTLYVPRGYEVEALQVFTPDIMVHLLDYGKKYNIEISHNNIYIHSDKIMDSKIKLEAFHNLAKYFVDEIGPVLALMKPSLLAQASEKENNN